jgi:hypothetical protein
MSMIESDGTVQHSLTPADYTADGTLKNLQAELSVCVGAAKSAEQFLQNKQWALLWRDADLLYQAPRPMTVYENTYILEPNVQRFTVAQTVNSIVPQLYKGLFYADPPMILRPRPGTSQNITDAKTAIFSFLLDECRFKTQTKWGLEQMAHLGTGIWKYGVEYKEVITRKRVASVQTITAQGPDGSAVSTNVPLDVEPKIITKTRIAPRIFFESCPIDRVLVDPKCAVGDIQHADFAIDVRGLDFYQLKLIKDGIMQLPDGHPDKEGWNLPKTDAELQTWWHQPNQMEQAQNLQITNSIYADGVVHHAEDTQIQVTPDVLFKKLEVLEYWDKKRKILVVGRKHVICSTKNPFGRLPFFSANWWNRPRAFYGMGLGLIVGQNQRVDQGTINSILKMLSFGINPIYLRKRDSNNQTQMIRTGLGKILTVDGPAKEAFSLLEQPKVPGEVWSALSESEKATERSSGADAQLVGGSTAGPRSGMGRTAQGASIQAGASASRLDGPLDNFIEQVFKPFLYVMDDLVFTYFSDAEVFTILGQEMGKNFEVNLQDFHDGVHEFETLAGSSLAAKRTMSQSISLITQIFENPTIQQNLAEINEEYIDFKPILKMWMESSEWKNVQDIIKPLTQSMKEKQAQQSQAAQAQTKANVQAQSNDQKFKQKQQLEDQATNNRIKRDVVLSAFKGEDLGQADNGTPSITGLGGQQPLVQ